MFCLKCGTQLPDDAAFCQKCGAKQTVDDTGQQSPDAPAQTVAPRRVASGRKHDVSQYLRQRTDAVEPVPTMAEQFTEQAASQPRKGQPVFAPESAERRQQTAAHEVPKKKLEKGTKIFIGVIAVMFVLGIIRSIGLMEYYSSSSGDASVTTTEKVEVTTTAPKNTELTKAEAKELLQAWLDNHFPNVELEEGDELYNDVDFPDHYGLAFMIGDKMMIVDVNKNTGELFRLGYTEDDELALMPLDQWFEEYGANYMGYEDEYYEDEYYEEEYDDYGFRREDYTRIGSSNTLIRYADQYEYQKVYIDSVTVVQVYESKLYLTKNNSGYFIIDDRNNSGVNYLKDDGFAIYGVFYGTETVNWNNGTSELAPYVAVDRIIYSEELPQDYTDFAQAVVYGLNTNEYKYTTDNKHLSGAKVQIICAAHSNQGDISYVQTNGYIGKYAGSIDGRITSIYLRDPATGNEIENFTEYAGIEITEARSYSSWTLMKVTGTISNVRFGTVSQIFKGLAVTIDVESIEPY
jgi:hypothetical protein